MDELGKSIPGAEGMVEAEEATRNKRHNENCLNCGTKLVNNFCHHCGQKDIPRRQTLGELFSNFISSFWSYEGKFFRSTKYLIIKPGFLAVEYNAGRRESYFHPARMYVFISFVFFLLFFSLPDQDKGNTKEITDKDLSDEDLKELKENYNKADLDSILRNIPGQDSTLNALSPDLADTAKKESQKRKKKRGLNWSLKKAEYGSLQAYDSAQSAKPEGERDGWIMRKFMTRAIELNQKYADDGSKFGEDFVAAFKENFSKILFYLLPVFALLLKLLYIRKDFFYSEHLVFSIYYYNFFYLAGSIQMLLNLVPALGWAGSLVGFWIFFYLLFAMKRLYGQTWGKTIFKFLLFTFVFFWIGVIGLGITAMAILMVI